MTEWLVIGGGPQAVMISLALIGIAGVPRNAITIVDPHSHLLARWYRTTYACGMTHLRSPGAHGLEPDFASLRRWCSSHGMSWVEKTEGPYRRPLVDLFNEYAGDVVRTSGLEMCLLQDKVVDLIHRDGVNTAILAGGDTIVSKEVVMAMGSLGHPNTPPWAQNPGFAHVYESGFSRTELLRASRPVVVGSGMSAVQLALSVGSARGSGRPVILISRKLEVSRFDSDPCYNGPRCLSGFLAAEPLERTAIIRDARYRGSVTPTAAADLGNAVEAGMVVHHESEVLTTRVRGRRIELVTGEAVAVADRVALGTGLKQIANPLITKLQQHAEEAGLDASMVSGVPVPAPNLRWAGVYLAGDLARVELGPSAANLIGGHNAAKRIVSGVKGALRRIPVSWSSY